MKNLILLFLASSIASAATPAPESVSEPSTAAESAERLPPKFYIKPSLGYTGSHGDFYSGNTFGVGFGIGAGAFIGERFSLGLFYKSKATTNGDFGMLGGGGYGASILGFESDVTVVKGESIELRLGGEVGRVSAKGIHSVLWFPYATSEIKSWGFGPTASFAYFFGNGSWGLGLELSYLHVLANEASVTYLTRKESTTEIPSFGVYDVNMVLHMRIF